MATTIEIRSQAAPIAGVGWRALLALIVAAIAGVFFWVVAALPYLILDQAHLSAYASSLRRASILVHISFGTLALLAGPVQLWLGLSDRRLGLHRRLGQIYMVAVLCSALAAFYLSTHTDGGWVFGSGLFGLAVAWLITTGLAYVAIRRHQIEQHKEWMIRSYVVTLAFVTFRLLYTILQAAHIGTPLEQIGLSAWFCWSVPLLITEAFLQARKVFA
jgi:uncharacterized membrane protein YozB (DUF420 family)